MPSPPPQAKSLRQKMMRLLLLLFIGVGAEAHPTPPLKINWKVMATTVTKLAADSETHDGKRGRSLSSMICDDESGTDYATSVLLMGEDLVQCLCRNNLLEDENGQAGYWTPVRHGCGDCVQEIKLSCEDSTLGPNPSPCGNVDEVCDYWTRSDDDSGSSNPCFARDTTTTCRVLDGQPMPLLPAARRVQVRRRVPIPSRRGRRGAPSGW